MIIVKKNFPRSEILLKDGSKLAFFLKEVSILAPTIRSLGFKETNLLPKECKHRNCDYTGKIFGRVGWSINGVYKGESMKCFGQVPIMIKVFDFK